jgi:hypothetical protein
MKTVLTLLVSAALVSSVQAFDLKPNKELRSSYECLATRNPTDLVYLFLEYGYDEPRQLEQLNITHYLGGYEGQKIHREDQYPDAKFQQRPHWIQWTGQRNGLRTVGTLDGRNLKGRPVTYMEKSFRGNRLVTSIDTKCHDAGSEERED